MAKAKKGDKLSCTLCGLVVVVDKACGCATAEVLCCKKPMAQGKPAVAKAGKKAAPPSSAAKTVKTAVAAKAKAGAAKTTITAKKAPAKAVAAKPKAAAPIKAAPKKAPVKKKTAAPNPAKRGK